MRLKGEVVRKGRAEGRALVSEEPLSFLGDVDPETGKIVKPEHPLKGESLRDRVLVFPHGKGSTVGSYVLYQLALNDTGPAAIINRRAEPIVAVGAIITDIPMVHKLNKNPIEVIENGDLVTLKDEEIWVKE